MNQVGLIGLGTMGSNLMLNLQDHQFSVVAHSYNPQELERTRETCPGPIYVNSTSELVNTLASPRRILLMVTAGAPVDEVLADLTPHLAAGDIVIDGGNSHFEDTNRRYAALQKAGIHYVGCGISGGEAGARHGAALMPGGDSEALANCHDIFDALVARVDGSPCYHPIGRAGSGHFVKMVHNGIEYGVMQILSEFYALLSRGYGLSNDECAEHFRRLNGGRTASYLMEITADILTRKDDLGDGDLIAKISDTAAQKGTGKWTVDAAMTLGVATPTINAAVTERLLSHQHRPQPGIDQPKRSKSKSAPNTETTESAIYTLVFACYAQGFSLIEAASSAYHWQIHSADVASTWRGGCIIRAALLEQFTAASQPTDQRWRNNINRTAATDLAMAIVQSGIAAPATLATIAYLNSLATEPLPTQLIQAQRDYFGHHGYGRVDKAGVFHYPWDRN